MVSLIPSSSIVLESPDPAEVVLQRLRQGTDTRSFLYRMPPKNALPFEGSVTAQGFSIRHMPDLFLNRTPPRISGRISNVDIGSKVEIRYSMSVLHLVGVYGITLWALFALYIIVSEYLVSGKGLWGVLFPLIIALFTYTFSIIGFRRSLKRDITLIRRLISGNYR